MQMSNEVLEEAIRQYIEVQPTREVVFVWHGGEPTLLPLSFYRKVVRWQRQYAEGHLISNCLQTNGTLLTPEWCQFYTTRSGWWVSRWMARRRCTMPIVAPEGERRHTIW